MVAGKDFEMRKMLCVARNSPVHSNGVINECDHDTLILNSATDRLKTFSGYNSWFWLFLHVQVCIHTIRVWFRKSYLNLPHHTNHCTELDEQGMYTINKKNLQLVLREPFSPNFKGSRFLAMNPSPWTVNITYDTFCTWDARFYNIHMWHDQGEWGGCRRYSFWDIGKESI